MQMGKNEQNSVSLRGCVTYLITRWLMIFVRVCETNSSSASQTDDKNGH